jgi:hypothetical protein
MKKKDIAKLLILLNFKHTGYSNLDNDKFKYLMIFNNKLEFEEKLVKIIKQKSKIK